MTIIHRLKLIPAKLKWFKQKYETVVMAFKRLKTILMIYKLKSKLEEKMLAKLRTNTEGSKEEAFGIKCQLDLINFLLGGKNVL
jgi:hypothetical protein